MGLVSAKHKPKNDKDYIIILGCKIKEDGTLLPLLKSRVDKAIEFASIQRHNTGKDIIFIPSGGKGNDEVISEAEAMKNYLLEKKINKNNMIHKKYLFYLVFISIILYNYSVLVILRILV